MATEIRSALIATGEGRGSGGCVGQGVLFVYTGREAVRSWTQDLVNQFAIQLTINSEEVEVFGDWAFVRTTYTTALTPKAGGEVVEERGKNIWIWKREADGSWKLARNIWNLDNQPAM